MKKLSLSLLASLLSLSGAAFAQSAASGEITESTDPSKAASIEQRAQELASQQDRNAAVAAQGKSNAAGATKPRKQRTSKSMAKAGKSADASSGASAGDSDKASDSAGSSSSK